MPRSAIDATRFTATKPHAFSKLSTSPASRPSPFVSKQQSGVNASPAVSTSASSQSPPPGAGAGAGSGSAPPHETAKQKVERLRAEAHARRLKQQFSRTDRILGTGRIWADRLHRTAVYTLIAASGIAGALTVYSITSLVLYNRRQKALWLERELDKLHDARKAFVAGSATPEQLQILQKEKEADELKRAREAAKRETWHYKARQWLFGGFAFSEQNVNAGDSGDDGDSSDDALKERPFVADDNSSGTAEIVSPASSPLASSPSSSDLPPSAATVSAENAEASNKKSWMSWLTGR